MPPRTSGTAWSHHGSLPSDRFRLPQPPPLAAQVSTRSDKGKAKAAAALEPPRSAAVRKLDELLTGLRSQHVNNNKKSTATPPDGCFCQARVHALSDYTPLCTTCGLILCSIQLPYRPCPHCDAPLLSLFARTALITQLEEQRAYTLAEEAAQREREAEALRQAEGAFPTLNAAATGTTTIANSTAARGAHTGSGTGGGAMTTTTTGASHRVLSLDAQTGRVRVVESYSTRSATLRSHETERGVDAAEAVVPPPPKEVEYVHVQRERATRWVDFKGDGGAKYVAPPPVHRAPQSERAGGKGKGKARERVVPSEAA